MGYKVVCFNCRKSFNRKPEFPALTNCPECGNSLFKYSHLFKPPRKDDLNAWKVVMFLREHGFVYNHVYEEVTRNERGKITGYMNYAKYPKDMIEAREFVVKYKDQARTLNV